MTALPIDHDVPTRILKRAQYEALVFEWVAGDVCVRNESYADPENHEYLVRVDDGRTTDCSCPADARFPYPCKHRIGLELRRPILIFVQETRRRRRS